MTKCMDIRSDEINYIERQKDDFDAKPPVPVHKKDLLYVLWILRPYRGKIFPSAYQSLNQLSQCT